MASAVMLRGTAVLSSALRDFEGYLERKGTTAARLVGVAADRRRTFRDMPMRADGWRSYVADLRPRNED